MMTLPRKGKPLAKKPTPKTWLRLLRSFPYQTRSNEESLQKKIRQRGGRCHHAPKESLGGLAKVRKHEVNLPKRKLGQLIRLYNTHTTRSVYPSEINSIARRQSKKSLLKW
jgi:hypothetical protein